jgi:4-hydroxythreonine-4-phosphate dehydrogenase
MNYKPILIVAGEPNSIFLEIFFKALVYKKFKSPIIIIVSRKLLNEQMQNLNFNYKINLIDKKYKDFKNLNNNKINIINVDHYFKKPFDKISKKSNTYINNCFKIALEFLKENKLSKFINGPISKKDFLHGKLPGITEYLAKKTGRNSNVAMLIYNKKLSVSPVTTHLPLKEVYKNISTKKIINHIELIVNFYKREFKRIPKIAITGLNPHCESNFKSSEEDKYIRPAIKALIKKNLKIKGPFAADTIFMNEHSKKYDVIVGMYHDQVLTPLKSLFGFDAINITLGLPFTRISPDHGPNHSMLGKNISDPKSLIEALKFLDK